MAEVLSLWDITDKLPYPFRQEDMYLVPFEGRGLLDLGIHFGPASSFDISQHSLTLYQVTKSGDTLTFDFRMSSDTSHRFVFTRSISSSEFGDIEYVYATNISTGESNAAVGVAYFVTGDLSRYADLPDGDLITGDKPRVTASCIYSTYHAGVGSFVIANEERTCPPVCSAGTPETVIDGVAYMAGSVTGDVSFTSGYNCRMVINPAANTLTIIPEVGAGDGEPIADILVLKTGEVVETSCMDYNKFITDVCGVSSTTGHILFISRNGIKFEADADNHALNVAINPKIECFSVGSAGTPTPTPTPTPA